MELTFLLTSLEKTRKFCYTLSMKTLYDVQQLLKQYGIFVYMGNRLYEIEVMKLELSQLYQMGLLDQEAYIQAAMVLRREHRLESDYQKKIGDKK